MHARQSLREIAVALVGDDDAAARLGDQEVGAGDADIGGEEFFPQLGARLGQDVAAFVEHAVRRQIGVRLAEAFLPVLLVEVERGRDDVAGQLVTQLDDVFAEIGLDRGDAVAFQVVVDAQLLADHRLALGDGAGIGRTADRQNRVARFVGGGAPVHLAAGLASDFASHVLQVEDRDWPACGS